MPLLHLGLYMISGSRVKQPVQWALTAGYRGFDSAQMYGNEGQTGQAIRDFLSGAGNDTGLKREDIFYTSKLASNSTSYDEVRRSIKHSVDVCGLGYIDLFLLHSPYGGRQARLTSWRALEDAVAAGEVRMAGVSNYGVRHVRPPFRVSYLFLLFPPLSPIIPGDASEKTRSWPANNKPVRSKS